MHSVKDTWNNAEEEVSYLVCWRRRRAVADQPAIFSLSLPLSLFLCFFCFVWWYTPFCRFTPSLFSSSPLVSPVYVFFVSLCCSSSSVFLFLSICSPAFFHPSVPRFCFSVFVSGSRPQFRSFLPSSPPVRIPSPAFIVGEWHAFFLAMKTPGPLLQE